MNCTQSLKMLDDYIDGNLSAIQYSTLHSHFNKCDACRAKFSQANQLCLRLKDIPVPPAKPGFEQRVLGFLEAQQTQTKRLNRWLSVGLYSAIAATLAIWLNISPVSESPSGVNHLSTIDLVVAKTRKVDLVFNLPEQLRHATLKIVLPEKIEVAGYTGKRQLQWKTSLRKGTNRLALSLIATQQNDGFLIAQLSKDGKTKTFRVQIKTQQPQSSLSIQGNRVINT